MRLTMLSFMGKKNKFSPKRPIWWIGVLLSSCVGLLFYLTASKSIEADSNQRFKNLAHTAQYSIGARIKSYADLLRGTASLFQVSENITRLQFRHYVDGLSLEEHYPAIETINFAKFVTEEERPAFEAKVHRDEAIYDGYPPFVLKPTGKRPNYSVLTYMEPIANAPEIFGVDVAAQPFRARALEESRDSGEVSNSGHLIVVPGRPAMKALAMRLPIYRAGMPTGNVAERRAAYIGSIGVGFNLQSLVQGVLSELPVRSVHVALYDGGTAAQPKLRGAGALVFDSQTALPPALQWTPSARSTLSTTVPINYNGRLWQAHFSVRKNDLYTRFDIYFPWLAMLAGSIGAMLIYALFHTLSSSRMRAIQMAKAMTQELRDSQAKLQISHQKLRRLAAHADHIKEEERKRIAREIHDDLGQNLLVLRIDADMLASRTERRHPRLNARARSTLSQIDATIKSVRHIINDLRPTVLDLGLNAAVEWQIAEFRRRTGIVCELNENQTDIRLNDHCATAFFRILQESLSNISQHAKASLVQVELKKDGDILSMTVKDNGIGVLKEGRNKVGSFGLVGIEERIKILGGKFSIKSSYGAGMTVMVSVPIKADPAYPYLEEQAELDDHLA
ncbi:CHASE domain-containing protein [Janthinobacterium fluminis]|uniref:CHASE domain-containing protein n=1 Tax=Janthinobacterium fluminis TaxID=2987524 RepID=A0ABT5JXC4_9BURK|nr:CHASE domain-containing protein [Janthinobacterium fluminis]MDC8757381.1 CHASE domain-containing protein [Janthinobacterium fluminis]